MKIRNINLVNVEWNVYPPSAQQIDAIVTFIENNEPVEISLAYEREDWDNRKIENPDRWIVKGTDEERAKYQMVFDNIIYKEIQEELERLKDLEIEDMLKPIQVTKS
ncbi:hypothetical protein [Halobacillus faecis]|uniref:Uncharacterized protein n=1 Tax=Halobacillus faecis TaxID=360184 RepID=A0A511WYF2_9BACI|nr:hypothetical protein [Halobacillus faecis]GEN55513.1 hypothetical protein HFA01_37750 [Halobacillus faecis]